MDTILNQATSHLDGNANEMLKGIIPNVSSTDNTPVSPPSATEKETESDKYMCKGFQDLYLKNQQKYNDEVFEGLRKYFEDTPTKAKLTAMLEQNIGQYIRSSQFRGATALVVKEAIGTVIKESLRNELKNPNNFKGMCNEISKLSSQTRRTTSGKRKRKMKTVKRRN